MRDFAGGLILFSVAALLAAGTLFTIGWGWARYRLWKAEYTGKTLEIEKRYEGMAILAQAENAKKARIATAQAEFEAAQLTADAIEIVGLAAKKFPEYRQQEFYLSLGEALSDGKIQQIIYLPTKAGLPITEAGKR
jgi:regulator of protease activity HflC (stomatin/prohibitin superfamily)